MKETFHTVHTAADLRSLLLSSGLSGDNAENLRKRILSDFEIEQIKQNPKRKVYRLSFPSGEELYLKLFARQNIFRSVLRFPARVEYQSARQLEQLGLPVIRYLAWGRFPNSGGFCISEGIPDAVPARQYVFQTLIHELDRQPDFFRQLAAAIRILADQRIRHPDLHLGNILWSLKTRQLYLADPWGVHPTPFWRFRNRMELCWPWLELKGSVPDEILLQGIRESGLATDSETASRLLNLTLIRYERRMRQHKEKFEIRILSGKSKFATEVILPEGKCAFRHSDWYAPPETFELNPKWHRVVFSTEQESREIWLNSFLKIPPVKNPPLARLICTDGSSALFYENEKN